MCLLFFKPAAVRFTDEQLADFWKRNQDGYGVMFAHGGELHIRKGIGKVEDWIAFHRQYEQYDACWHTRMRTHGDIDLENCHPYVVYGEANQKVKLPVAMMHNGVLSMGNAGDKSKSDTWHYIRNYIRPLTTNDPDVIFSKEFKDIIGNHIGSSNKFALMDSTGRVQLINKSSGIEWEGVWFSNTYAWDSRNEKLYPGVGKSHPSYGYGSGYNTYYAGRRAWDDFDEYYPSGTTGSRTGTTGATTHSTTGKSMPHHTPLDKKVGKKGKKKKSGRLTDVATKALDKAPLPNRTAPHGTQHTLHLPVPLHTTGAASHPKPLHPNYTDWDVDYVNETIVDEFPTAAKKITVEQIETLLMTFGATRVIDLVEQAIFQEITEEDLIEMFRNQVKAADHFERRGKSAHA